MVPDRPFLPPSVPRLPARAARYVEDGTRDSVPDTITANFSMSVSSVGPVTTQDTSATDSFLLDSLPLQFSLPSSVASPIRVSNLEFLLSGYPPEIVEFLIQGFSHGFRLGFGNSPLSHTGRNNSSATLVSDKVSASILKELERSHTAGPFSNPPLPNLHCSPLGSALKNDGSSRIILDLSQPDGSSVNDGIPIDSCHVKYSSFDDAVDLVRLVGRGCFMGKIDIRHAFRLCPVHPDDWHLLGYYWRSRWYVDLRLPFGLRSSPFIFTTFSDALQWILVVKYHVTALVHYLDDFFVVGRTKEECQYRMDLIVQVFEFLGVPIATDKFEGPSQKIVFLGIEIDSIDLTIRLPDDKKNRLSSTIESWLVRKKCTKRDLLSLIGSLSFACKVIKPGRIFLRRLIDLSTTVSKPHYHVSIPKSVRDDLNMWFTFLKSWNGKSFMLSPIVTSRSLSLSTDASFLGYGSFFQGHWFSLPWPSSTAQHKGQPIHIAIRELFAIYAALTCWRRFFSNQQILIFTDNESIVSVWASGTSKDPRIMCIVRALFFLSVDINASFTFQHVAGKDNTFSDLLSRLQVEKFRSICPASDQHPSAIPTSTMDLWDEILSIS
eukprot:TCONS_00050701-protein